MSVWLHLLLLALGFYSAFGLHETETNRHDSSDLIKNKEDDNDSSDTRRHVWESVDGKILGSLGRLFGDKIKEEADKERMERENMRKERLLEKYTNIMNDPDALEQIKRESANAPSEINQQVRRSFSPSGFSKQNQTNVPNKLLVHPRDLEESSNSQETNYHRANTVLVQIILPTPQGCNCRSQTLQKPDYLGVE